MIPMIKAKLKPEHLPTWDGNHATAIEYIWKIQQLASLGGYVPLWSRLVDGPPVQAWFATLTFTQQANMRQHYMVYLRNIQKDYLGNNWQLEMNAIESVV
jgi:hypothetical protein